MDSNPHDLALDAIEEHGPCACRELRNEVADAAHSMRLDDAQAYLSAACIVCGRQRRWRSAAELGYVDARSGSGDG
jgi:hypothetical protein